MWLAFALACAPEPLGVSAAAEGDAVRLQATRPGFTVELLDADGAPVVRAAAPAAATEATVALPPGMRGRLLARVRQGGERAEVTVDLGDAAALDAQLALPLGAPARPLRDGDTHRLVLLEGAQATAALRVRAPADQAVQVWLDTRELAALAPGESRLVDFPVAADAALRVEPAGGAALRATLDVQPLSLPDAARRLGFAELRFPALQDGRADPIRPPGRLTLPSPWWRSVVDHTPLGVRARDPYLPWAWTAVELQNAGDAPMDVVVRARVLGADGRPDPAFRPRMRDADDGTGQTSALLRVPAGGRATASLPLFVDEAALADPRSGRWTREVEVLALGVPEPLLRDERPLYVSRSSSGLAVGLALTLGAAAAGAAWTLRGVGRWLRELDTAALVTVALFGALQFVTGTVGLLLGLGAAAAAGPFSTLVTGVVDDALQATLTGTLVFLLPRPGTATLTVLVAWLLRGVATGTLSPLDVVFVSCRIATLEASLWVFGLTRGGAWRDAPRGRRVLRLGLGLASASLLGTAASLVLHSALFRLYYAPWYVAMVLTGPGLLYALAASGLAERVATQLRRVED